MSHTEAQKAHKATRIEMEDEDLAAAMEREREELEETWARPPLTGSRQRNWRMSC